MRGRYRRGGPPPRGQWESKRERFAACELGLDIYSICPTLEAAGLKYIN
jgi:hypothetical protein